MSNKEAKEWVLAGNRLAMPKDTPPVLTTLLTKCWEHEPTARPTFSEVSFFRKSKIESRKSKIESRIENRKLSKIENAKSKIEN